MEGGKCIDIWDAYSSGFEFITDLRKLSQQGHYAYTFADTKQVLLETGIGLSTYRNLHERSTQARVWLPDNEG